MPTKNNHPTPAQKKQWQKPVIYLLDSGGNVNGGGAYVGAFESTLNPVPGQPGKGTKQGGNPLDIYTISHYAS